MFVSVVFVVSVDESNKQQKISTEIRFFCSRNTQQHQRFSEINTHSNKCEMYTVETNSTKFMRNLIRSCKIFQY